MMASHSRKKSQKSQAGPGRPPGRPRQAPRFCRACGLNILGHPGPWGIGRCTWKAEGYSTLQEAMALDPGHPEEAHQKMPSEWMTLSQTGTIGEGFMGDLEQIEEVDNESGHRSRASSRPTSRQASPNRDPGEDLPRPRMRPGEYIGAPRDFDVDFARLEQEDMERYEASRDKRPLSARDVFNGARSRLGSMLYPDTFRASNQDREDSIFALEQENESPDQRRPPHPLYNNEQEVHKLQQSVADLTHQLASMKTYVATKYPIQESNNLPPPPPDPQWSPCPG